MSKPFADLQMLDEVAGMDPDFRLWREGYGVIRHLPDTQQQVLALAEQLVAEGLQPDTSSVYRTLAALDRITSAGLWLVVHMTYARRVDVSGQPLASQDFKTNPEGHTGGALNMVPGYAGYLALNNLTGRTRSWLMGQGHCVAAIEALDDQDLETAIENFIEVVRTNRDYDDDGARKACIALFTLLGEKHSLTQEHRRTFDMALY